MRASHPHIHRTVAFQGARFLMEGASPEGASLEDVKWMTRALALAEMAASKGEVPVGAVLVRDHDVLAEGHNLTVTSNDPTAHAEVVVIREAAKKLGDWRLTDCTLYVTLEPCAMCAGALVLSRVSRLVFGAADPKAGMVGSLGNLAQDERLNHWIEVTDGTLAEQAGDLLRDFFRRRRGS
jgi:tRNA(adenine34) deaminase